MNRNPLSEAIHLALMYPEELEYWDMPKYEDGVLFPPGIYVAYCHE